MYITAHIMVMYSLLTERIAKVLHTQLVVYDRPSMGGNSKLYGTIIMSRDV